MKRRKIMNAEKEETNKGRGNKGSRNEGKA
jgi:hypothetical protein